MGDQFWWIFDAIVVMIVGYIIFSNAKRGLTKVFVLNIGYVVALLLSAVVAIAAGPLVYESSVETTNITAFEKVNADANFPQLFADAVNAEHFGFNCEKQRVAELLDTDDNSGFVPKLYAYCSRKYGGTFCGPAKFEKLMQDAFTRDYGKAIEEHLPGYVAHNLQKLMAADPKLMTDVLTAYYGSSSVEAGAKVIEGKIAQAPTLELLRMFTFVCVFTVIMIIVALISAMLKNTLFFNVSTGSERTYGALLGLAETFSMLLLFTILTRVLVLLGNEDILCFNEPTIAATKIFRMLYDNLSFLI